MVYTRLRDKQKQGSEFLLAKWTFMRWLPGPVLPDNVFIVNRDLRFKPIYSGIRVHVLNHYTTVTLHVQKCTKDID